MYLFLAQNRIILLPLALCMWGYCFYKQKDIPLLLVSILLLFLIRFDLRDIPVIIRLGLWNDFLVTSFVLVWPSLLAGIWGIIHSIRGLMVTILRSDAVVDNWNRVVEQGAGRGGFVLGTVEKMIIDAGMPGVTTRQEPVSIGLFGEERPFLIVQNARYKEFKMYINARDLGTNLDVSWYFVAEPRFLKRTLSRHATGNPQELSMRVNLFAQQDILAFKAVTHNYVKRTLEILYDELKLDPSGLNMGSRGFLNVW